MQTIAEDVSMEPTAPKGIVAKDVRTCEAQGLGNLARGAGRVGGVADSITHSNRMGAPVKLVMLVAVVAACDVREPSPSVEETGQGDRLARIEKLETALKEKPDDMGTLRSLGLEYWGVGQYDDAQATFERVLARGLDSVVLKQLAALLSWRGRYIYAARLAKQSAGHGSPADEWLRTFVDQFDALSRSGAVALKDPPQFTGAVNSIGMSFVDVPGGQFMRGDDSSGFEDDKPVRAIMLSPYWIGKYEVTNAQFRVFLKETGYAFTPRTNQVLDAAFDEYPLAGVSWEDAEAFTMWLSAREGAVYRLPTEAEWECAARGQQGFKQPWGNDRGKAGVDANWRRVGVLGMITGKAGIPVVDRVGRYSRDQSPFGVFDMAGNVKEWCLDWYDSRYYAWSPSRDPYGPVSERQTKVLRGGAWNHRRDDNFGTFRDHDAVNKGYTGYGFRVVREHGAPQTVADVGK